MSSMPGEQHDGDKSPATDTVLRGAGTLRPHSYDGGIGNGGGVGAKNVAGKKAL